MAYHSIILFERFIILFNYKHQYVIYAPLSQCSPQPNMLVAWVSSLELVFLCDYKAFLLYTLFLL